MRQISEPEPSTRLCSAGATWHQSYWLFAALIPSVLYAFEAAQTIFYLPVRAANVSLSVQLSVMFCFFAVMVGIPWLCWQLAARQLSERNVNWQVATAQLGGLGIVLSAAHLLLLTIIMRAFHATATWAWTPASLLHGFGETWLRYAGMWLITFGLICAVVVYVLYKQRESIPTISRFEIRHNGRILSLSLDEIYWIKALGNYAEVHSKRGIFVIRQPLKRVKDVLAPGGFLSVHRSAIVNAAHVQSVCQNHDRGGYSVRLTNGDSAPLSRRQLAPFRRLLKSVGTVSTSRSDGSV